MSSTTDAVQRIRLGRVVAPSATLIECSDGSKAPPYRVGWGERPKGAKGHLAVVGAAPLDEGITIYDQLKAAMPSIKQRTLPLDKGPYADKDGRLADFIADIYGEADSIHEIIQRTVDTRPYCGSDLEEIAPRTYVHPVGFHLNVHFMPPDALPTAGEILSQDGRLAVDDVTGAPSITISHFMEPYLLAVSALRRIIPKLRDRGDNGLVAYPAFAVLPDDGPKPLIALVDLNRDIPLVTFTLTTTHPPLGAIDLISDEAMLAIVHTMHAEARVKNLTTEMAIISKDDQELSEEELGQRLRAVAESLFEAHKLWPGTSFVKDAFGFIGNAVSEVLSVIDQVNFQKDPEGTMQRSWETVAAENPMIAAQLHLASSPEFAFSVMRSAAIQTASKFIAVVQNRLSEMIGGNADL